MEFVLYGEDFNHKITTENITFWKIIGSRAVLASIEVFLQLVPSTKSQLGVVIQSIISEQNHTPRPQHLKTGVARIISADFKEDKVNQFSVVWAWLIIEVCVGGMKWITVCSSLYPLYHTPVDKKEICVTVTEIYYIFKHQPPQT